MQAPCLFLSHSGADTDGARELKRRLLQSPEAREAGLTVWFDKDDLTAGLHWQEQLEVAITRQATAFAVMVGSKGVINWVEREVRLGLARATGEDAIPFVSIVAEGAAPEVLNALPAFAQQHQGVIDPLNDPVHFAKLIDAVLGRTGRKPARLTDEPFVGLRAMTEREADRFFGRTAEVAELVDDMRRHRLIAIVADSGAGKSSLAMAGLAPAFRGGALASEMRRGPEDAIWHVVVMRPGADPIEGLRRGVTDAAERMGLSPDARASLRRRVTLDDINEAAYALRCDLPAGSTETLLIVDQFDELLTETPEAARQPFIDALLKLAAMRGLGGFYVVLTVRVDYFNLCRPYGALYAELQTSERVLRLKRISDAGLEQAVQAPLRMAGFADEDDRRALATEMRRDLSDRPGDLALAQMALWTVWRNRLAHGGSLLKAYVDVGGVSGALAQEAEQVRLTKLSDDERILLPALFVRLVRLGETGGVLRRLADKTELDEARAGLAEKLASDDHGRLLLVSEGSRGEGAKVEVCHEALITQWPWLQNTLNAAAPDLRVLDRLMDRAATWTSAPEAEHGRHRATGAERELFAELGQRRGSWLSVNERAFIDDSNAAFAAEETARSRAVSRLRLLVAVLGVAVVALVGVAWFAIEQTGVARTEKALAEEETRVAGVQKARAEEQTGIAEAQKARAEEQTRIAEAQKARAEAQTRITETEKARAEEQTRIAEAQKARAEEQTRVAEAEKARAEEETRIAEAQKTRAEEETRIAETEKARAEEQTLIAKTEKGRADRDFDAARETIDRLIFDIAQGLENAPGMRVSIIRTVLDTVKTTIDALAAVEPDDKRLQRSRSVMLSDFVSIYLRTGDVADAVTAATDNLTLARKLANGNTDDQAQQDLAVALERTGDTKLQTGDLGGARAAYEEELTVFRSLAGDKTDAKAQRSVAVALERVGNVKLQAGDRAGARAAYEEELAIDRRLAADKGDQETRHDLAVALERTGDMRLLDDDVAGARAAYEEELAIDRDLAAQNSDAQAQGNLAVALERIGKVKLRANDLAGSRAAYEEELAIFRELAKDKDDAQAQRSLAIALEKIGDVKLQAKDLAGARAAYEEELAIDGELANDKGDKQAQRSLAIALEKTGDVRMQAREPAEARALYEESLAIFRELAKDRGDAQAQRSLSTALDKIGDMKQQAGDLEGAGAAYAEELAIDRDLAAVTGDLQTQRDIALDLDKVGNVKRQSGDLAGARAAYEEELAIDRKLAADRNDIQAQSSVAFDLERVGGVKEDAGDLAGARAAYAEGLVIARKVAAVRKDAASQRSVAVALERFGDVTLAANDVAGARAAYEEELGIFRTLDEANDDAAARRSVAIALERVGKARLRADDVAGARKAYDEELAIFRRLADGNDDPDTRRSVAIALEKVGDVKLRARDLGGGLAAYAEELAIFRRLAADDDSAEARRSLTIALDKIGDAKLQAADRAGARAAYLEELTILQRLARENQLSTAQRGWIDDVKTKLTNLASRS